jgi:spermidine/putrescine transport system permease protein
MALKHREEHKGFWMAFPGMAWLSLFFLVPLAFVLVASFLTRGDGGQAVPPTTLENYGRSFDTFGVVIWRSVVIALYTTFWCFILGYPMAFFISTRKSERVRLLLLFLILLPFWTNFLVRTYALKSIISPEGIMNNILMSLGLIKAPIDVLFSEFAVILGLVYGFLPFMVLPVYAAVERLDFRFVEAANDLGANDWSTFWRVIFPLTLPGVVAGSMLVFIPAIGSYVTPDLLGGTRGLMIGNLIARQFGGRGNIPLGSAVSVILVLLVLMGVVIYIRYGQERTSRG